MARDGTGVTEAAGKIQLSFQFMGSRCRETLDLKWSVSNIRAAENTLLDIKKKIKEGAFDYATEFPNSLKVKRGKLPRTSGAGGRLLSEVIDAWLVTKAKLAPNTRKGYRNAGECWKTIFGIETTLSEMTFEHVATTIASHPFASGGLQNDYLIVLRGACEMAAKGDTKWSNPMIGIENAKTQKAKPDPLSRDEMKKVLEYMHKHFDPRVHAWFVFMFESGERPEEGIAHEWRDVDWQRKTIHVERARSLSITGPCKTYETRDIDLSTAALDALRLMRAHPMTKLADTDIIFQNPNINGPWNDNRSQHDQWVKALKACKIRTRRSYNTRHTFATLRLMIGAVPAYISRQMGHESAIMLFKTYARWIDGDKSERDRVQKLLALAA